MNIFFDTSNFDYEKFNIEDYLRSIKENFPDFRIYISINNSKINQNYQNKYDLKYYDNNCEIIIYFKYKDLKNNSIEKFKYNFFFDINYPWWSYRLRTNDDKSHFLLDPEHDSTVFGRLGKKNSDEIFYFPYSFLFRCSGLGPIDKYGFRKKKISNSNNNIMILGGSACWGYNVLQSESFIELLQNKINEMMPEKNYHIFNFAQHSHLLLDQFYTFLLHHHKIKPKIVIMHDGFNDLQFGMITDKSLIKDKITYALTHEHVSMKIYNKPTQLLTHKDSTKMGIINTPSEVIKAYYDHKESIRIMIESLGIKFYSSLQPFLFSKEKLSSNENNYLKEYDIKNSTYGEPYYSCKFLYDKISDENFYFDINFHKEFLNLNDDLFVDFCHLNKAGEKTISEIYFNFLKDKL